MLCLDFYRGKILLIIEKYQNINVYELGICLKAIVHSSENDISILTSGNINVCVFICID
jgi:hypothetical protein